MGFFNRLREVKEAEAGSPVNLPLVAPTRLSVKVPASPSPSLIAYVLDPALLAGEWWPKVRELTAMTLTPSQRVLPDLESDETFAELRDAIQRVSFLGSFADLVLPGRGLR